MTFEEWWDSDISTDDVCKSRYDKAEAAWEAGIQEGIDRMYRMYDLCVECKIPYDEHKMDCSRRRTHEPK